MRLKLFAILAVLPMLALLVVPARAIGLNDVKRALVTPFKEKKIQDYTAEFFQQSKIASLDRLQRARGRVSVRFDDRRSGKVPTVMFHWEYEEPTRQEIVSDGKTLWVYLPENNQVIQSDIEMVSQARDTDPMTFLTGLHNLDRDFLISWATPNRDVEGNYVLDLRPRRTTALINRMVIVVDRDAVEGETAGAATQGPTSSFTEATPRPSRGSDLRQPAHGASETAVPQPNSFFDDNFDPSLPITDSRSAIPQPSPFSGESSRPGTSFGNRRQSGGLIFPILSTTVYDPNGNSTTIEFSDVRVNRGLSAGQFRFMIPAGVEVVRPTGKEMGF